MKRTMVSFFLCIFAMRLAVMAGAEDSIKNWVAELEPDSEPVVQQVECNPCEDDGVGNIITVPVEFLPESGEQALSNGERPRKEAAVAVFSSELSIKNDSGRDIDAAALSAQPLGIELPSAGPQILIIHTHGSEAYTPTAENMYTESDPYRTEDKSKNVIHVGDVLTETFQKLGLEVIHDREIYDYPSYTGSYSRSGAAVEEYLAKYPGISVVIDLHRDALGSGDVVYKTRAETESGECAQVMLLVGTGENGLYHPNWERNMKLGLYLQNAMEESCPTLARPLCVKSERYNQHLSPGAIILEVGSTGNSLEEAVKAIEVFGNAAGEALLKLVKNE